MNCKSLGWRTLRGGWCHDLAKWLSHYLYLSSFLFLLDLLHKGGVWESVTWPCHMSHCDVTQMKSHNNHGKVVRRPCSNCISSVQEMHKDSIEFSLSSTDKGAVGFIPAQELAILTWGNGNETSNGFDALREWRMECTSNPEGCLSLYFL